MLVFFQARERMTKSTVVDSKTGGSIDSEVRTSTGSFYSRGQDEVGCKMIGKLCRNCSPCTSANRQRSAHVDRLLPLALPGRGE